MMALDACGSRRVSHRREARAGEGAGASVSARSGAAGWPKLESHRWWLSPAPALALLPSRLPDRGGEGAERTAGGGSAASPRVSRAAAAAAPRRRTQRTCGAACRHGCATRRVWRRSPACADAWSSSATLPPRPPSLPRPVYSGLNGQTRLLHRLRLHAPHGCGTVGRWRSNRTKIECARKFEETPKSHAVPRCQ